MTGEGWGEGEDPGSASAEPALSPAEEPALNSAEGSSPAPESSFPRKPSYGAADREAPGPAESHTGESPEHGSQLEDAGPGPVLDTGPVSSRAGMGTTQTTPTTQRGCYDIDRKITEAQRDPSHPIHKFVQAYDEVAAVFHGKDKKNDDDEEVRYWISGEVVDAYGKYIWEYAPAYPRSIRRKLRPKRRRRSREPGTAPKAESIWMKRPSDKMREEGIKPPKRTLMWI